MRLAGLIGRGQKGHHVPLQSPGYGRDRMEKGPLPPALDVPDRGAREIHRLCERILRQAALLARAPDPLADFDVERMVSVGEAGCEGHNVLSTSRPSDQHEIQLLGEHRHETETAIARGTRQRRKR